MLVLETHLSGGTRLCEEAGFLFNYWNKDKSLRKTISKTRPHLTHFILIFYSGLGVIIKFLFEVLFIYLNFTENLGLFRHLEITVSKKIHVFSLGQFYFFFFATVCKLQAWVTFKDSYLLLLLKEA